MSGAPTRSRGLREKIFVAANPLPKTTERELFALAGIETRQPAEDHIDPFALEWQYGSRSEGELVRLGAGETILLRESESTEFMNRFKDEGGTIYPADATEAEIKKARLAGLRKAQEFFALRGGRNVIEFRKTHGYGKEDVEDFKDSLLWPYFLNDAKVMVIKSLIAETEGKTPKARVPQADKL